MAGIKQTDDVVRAAAATAVFILRAREGGYGLDDLTRAVGDEQLRGKVVEGIRDVSAVPGEISDADVREVMSLALSAARELGLTG